MDIKIYKVTKIIGKDKREEVVYPSLFADGDWSKYPKKTKGFEIKEGLDELIKEIPIVYKEGLIEECFYEARVFTTKNEILVYPKEGILEGRFEFKGFNRIKKLMTGRGGIGFNFKGKNSKKGNNWKFYYVNPRYDEQLKEFQEAIKKFRGFWM